MITSEGSLLIACMAVVCWQIKPSLARARPSPLEGSRVSHSPSTLPVHSFASRSPHVSGIKIRCIRSTRVT